MKKILRMTVTSILKLLPAGAPEKIYARLFRGPLGKLVNPLISALLPKNVRLPEGFVVLNPQDPVISAAVAFGAFEPYETELFRKTVTSGMTVIDIGANIGYYTVIASSRTGTAGRVIAFEPAPENFGILEETIRINGFRNVDAHMLAIADAEGVFTLNLHDTNKGKHSLVKGMQNARGFATSVQVMATTLESFRFEKGVEHVDVIKMDIEGAESIALVGMPEALKKAKVLFFEFTPSAIRKAGHDPLEVLSRLRVAGFSIHDIRERTKSKELISNDNRFIDSIPNDECANLFCIKNAE